MSGSSRESALDTGAERDLPQPTTSGAVSLEAALWQRRSVREFSATPLSLAELSQLVWSAQGLNRTDGGRTAPSAGARYPIEVSVVAGRVAGLAPGVYRYLPAAHRLRLAAAGDRRRALAEAAFEQDWMERAPASLLLAAVEERTASRYRSRAKQYVPIDAGAAAENVALQAVALGLGTTLVGAFEDARVSAVAALAADERPLLILPVGRPRAAE